MGNSAQQANTHQVFEPAANGTVRKPCQWTFASADPVGQQTQNMGFGVVGEWPAGQIELPQKQNVRSVQPRGQGRHIYASLQCQLLGLRQPYSHEFLLAPTAYKG